MRVEQAELSDDAVVASVLQEAAAWLEGGGRPLWSSQDVGNERVQIDTAHGRYFVARSNGGEVVGVVRIDLEDPVFWPEIESGNAAFVHKLAVRRSAAGEGVSTTLLDFARAHTARLGRPFLRLDCVADRAALRGLYERFGFALHSVVHKGAPAFARYELRVSAPVDSGSPAVAAAPASPAAPG